MRRDIVFAMFPDFQLLDATGPIAAFEIATRYASGGYRQRLCAIRPGMVTSSAGVALAATRLGPIAGVDTLIVVGGFGTRTARHDPALLRFVRRAAGRLPRIASVCSGALVLAQAGVLDGRRATTHWSRARGMARDFPAVHVEPDRIWVRDGKFWTSAGITAGIDLALAMIAQDHGPEIARDVARQLVVYAQRPGGQTQHSALLDLGAAETPFAALNSWIRVHLRADLSVPALAARVHMSPRNFARAYVAATGVTPGKAVERLRVEAARAAIESGASSLLDVADQAGFGDLERMRRSFVRLFGAPPSSLRRSRAARAERAPI
jgi:transcriptional regulator GlxA family with amidase domain